MHLILPFRYPEVYVPSDLAVTVQEVPGCGLPGVEVNLYLPNGFGLSLLHGRGHSTASTVEAQVITHDGTWENTQGYPGSDLTHGADNDTEGWVDGEWITAALVRLAALPPR